METLINKKFTVKQDVCSNESYDQLINSQFVLFRHVVIVKLIKISMIVNKLFFFYATEKIYSFKIMTTAK